MNPTPNTLDDVLASLDEVVAWSKSAGSRLGYFAALYRKVTRAVKKGISDDFFDDGARMERLDVLFARRYLDAFHRFREGQPLTASWQHAFAASARWRPIVLQHLLLGMNAHINLDLGIAASETVPAEELDDLRGDFNKINTILASLTAEVQDELADVWTTLGLFNRYLGQVDDEIVGFSMTIARDDAWSFAQQLVPLAGPELAAHIEERDAEVAHFANTVSSLGVLVSLLTGVIRLGERGSVADIITILE